MWLSATCPSLECFVIQSSTNRQSELFSMPSSNRMPPRLCSARLMRFDSGNERCSEGCSRLSELKNPVEIKRRQGHPSVPPLRIRDVAERLLSNSTIQPLDHPVPRQGKLDHRLDVKIPQVKQAAPDHHRRCLAGPTGEIPLVQQQHPVAATT